jgi:DNA-binding MarR family transcriptional regulator
VCDAAGSVARPWLKGLVADVNGNAGERDDAAASLVQQWGAVVRAIDSVQHVFATRLESLGMSLPYFSVLTLLFEAEDHRLPMSRIARDLAMTSGGFTKLADRMARDGLIDRRGSAGDRRVVFAALTDAGLEQAQHATDVYRTFLRDHVLQAISREQLDALVGLTRNLDAIKIEADPDAASFQIMPRTPDAPERRSRG